MRGHIHMFADVAFILLPVLLLFRLCENAPNVYINCLVFFLSYCCCCALIQKQASLSQNQNAIRNERNEKKTNGWTHLLQHDNLMNATKVINGNSSQCIWVDWLIDQLYRSAIPFNFFPAHWLEFQYGSDAYRWFYRWNVNECEQYLPVFPYFFFCLFCIA